VSAGLGSPAAIETEASSGFVPRSERGARPDGERRLRVGIVGATGYVGAELIRLLSRHPNVDIVGLAGRDRQDEPIGGHHPHLAATDLTVTTHLPEVDAAFLALPHGAAVGLVSDLIAAGTAVIDLGPDFRLAIPTTTRAGTASSIHVPISSSRPSTACRSCIARSFGRWPTRRSPSSARRGAIRRPRCSRSRPWRVPG
jgi:hypothetical protein